MTQQSLLDYKFRAAQESGKRRFDIGEQQQAILLQSVAKTVIRDRLVAPRAMYFTGMQAVPRLTLRYEGRPDEIRVHHHALTQLCQKVQLPLTFANQLNLSGHNHEEAKWKTELLAHVLTTLFQKSAFSGPDTKFLHRIVGDELRGFLSRRYNRHLATAPMLRAFLDAAKKAGAQPVEGRASDTRVALKCFLPMVFEAYPGQYLCVGCEFTNSDFGAGKLAILQSVWDPLRDTRAVLDETISRVHLGSVIEESDIEMSEETASKEVEAQALAIRDAVTQQLSENSVLRLLEAVKVAHEEQVPWARLKNQLSRYLYKKDIQDLESLLSNADVIDLPPPGRGVAGEAIPNKWWCASALSHLANKTDDADHAEDLQRAAGALLAGKEE